MPIYEYKCEKCGHAFEAKQSIKDVPMEKCPKCGAPLRRGLGGGIGFSVKGGSSRTDYPNCAFRRNGVTCCGLDEPCGRK